MSRARTIRSVKRSCDLLWSLLIRERAGGRCERCGRSPEDSRGFHAHHIYGRSNHRLRFEPRNGMAVCMACHRWAEEYPLEFTDWLRAERPEDAAWLAVENRRGLLKRDLADYLALELELRELLG